jgi:2-polyprenyl-3-methyl-5-hydroxy-6-metoxy-1,4-benzoquinol methylase
MSGGRAMYADSEEHVALVLRTLGLDEARWSQMLDRYCELWAPQASVEQRLGALAVAFASVAPHAAEPPDAAASKCIVCGAVAVEPVVAKRASKAPLVYGRCHDCGHGIRLAGPTIEGIYDGDAYYRQRSVDGTGYDAYQAERSYREAKGARLVAALETSLGVSPASSLLEVGSGFGYTLAAAAGRGWRCQGIDVNPEAARAAKQLYGFETRACTLEQALATGSVATGAWEVVLYHFVLEHVADPLSELLTAARALRPGGSLVLVVPSMSTFELDVFGASYRSLRADHLHLFSARSIGQLLQAAGLELSSLQSHCSLHLARGFLNQTELDDLYASGRGPDFTVLAQRKKS